jgi:hypothetical protein
MAQSRRDSRSKHGISNIERKQLININERFSCSPTGEVVQAVIFCIHNNTRTRTTREEHRETKQKPDARLRNSIDYDGDDCMVYRLPDSGKEHSRLLEIIHAVI